jgi:hypothetical protein
MALNKLLNTDLSALARLIQDKGRGRDTILAHITPQEAALLKSRGGRGSINPDTGLPEFDDGASLDTPTFDQPVPADIQPTPSDVATPISAVSGPGLTDTGGAAVTPAGGYSLGGYQNGGSFIIKEDWNGSSLFSPVRRTYRAGGSSREISRQVN